MRSSRPCTSASRSSSRSTRPPSSQGTRWGERGAGGGGLVRPAGCAAAPGRMPQARTPPPRRPAAAAPPPQVTGTVFKVDNKGAYVDVGGKSAAFCATDELSLAPLDRVGRAGRTGLFLSLKPVPQRGSCSRRPSGQAGLCAGIGEGNSCFQQQLGRAALGGASPGSARGSRPPRPEPRAGTRRRHFPLAAHPAPHLPLRLSGSFLARPGVRGGGHWQRARVHCDARGPRAGALHQAH